MWDEALFPDTTSSLAGGKAAPGEDVRTALDALNANEDVVDSKEEGSGKLSGASGGKVVDRSTTEFIEICVVFF